jgi:hypothetical protein
MDELPKDDPLLRGPYTKGVRITEWTKGQPRRRANRYIVRLRVKGGLTWCREDPRGNPKALSNSKAKELMQKYGPELVGHFPETKPEIKQAP